MTPASNKTKTTEATPAVAVYSRQTAAVPSQDRPDDLIARLADPNQPSIHDEIRYIVSLQLSNAPEEWTVADEKQWNAMFKNALGYNRLRRAVLCRNAMLGSGNEMTLRQFEKLANTGSCKELGISEKEIFKTVLKDFHPATYEDEAYVKVFFQALHETAA